MIEQIVMGTLGKQFDPLRIVGGAVHPPAHFHGGHRILLAVQDKNRTASSSALRMVSLPDKCSYGPA